MVEKKHKNIPSLIGKSFIIIAIIIFSNYNIYKLNKKNIENEELKPLMIEVDNDNLSIDEQEVKTPVLIKKSNSNYIGVLEIPKLYFKKGFYDINDLNNDVNKNIELLSGSVMPNYDNSILVFAGHSGNGELAYFNDIDKLVKGDDINVYYNNKKYEYIVIDIYNEEKVGSIKINDYNNKLILTTCNQSDKTKQLIVEAKLRDN